MAGEKILVIDDDPDIRQAITMTLEYEGYQCLFASSGKEGLSSDLSTEAFATEDLSTKAIAKMDLSTEAFAKVEAFVLKMGDLNDSTDNLSLQYTGEIRRRRNGCCI